MKKLVLVFFLSIIGIGTQAQEKTIKKSKNAKVEFAVNGNCEMCKKRIEKAAFSVKGVKSANWDIDHKDVHLIMDETKCTVEDVAKAIAEVGHDSDYAKATDAAYENLHGCCLYERIE
jgi:periplasmic mercuric ion binding protein